MARLVSVLTVDASRLRPMYDSLGSLGEALSVAQFDGEIELESQTEGMFFAGQMIVRIYCGPFIGGTVALLASPTFRMPLFASEIQRLVPGVKVKWRGGWPHFSANDGDDPEPEEPGPVAPEELVL